MSDFQIMAIRIFWGLLLNFPSQKMHDSDVSFKLNETKCRRMLCTTLRIPIRNVVYVQIERVPSGQRPSCCTMIFNFRRVLATNFNPNKVKHTGVAIAATAQYRSRETLESSWRQRQTLLNIYPMKRKQTAKNWPKNGHKSKNCTTINCGTS